METAALHLKITSDGMDTAKKGLDGLENAAGMVESAFKKLVAAAALFKAGTFIGDITQLAARYETLGTVMGVVGNNAGYTRKQMDEFAASLQRTGISMMESRNTLAMMASAHIDLTKASELGRIAQDAAKVGNLNSSEAFQRMIYGIQSGQVEILRTIGLNVNFEASYAKLAKQLGKSAKDLSELEKVQARTNAVQEKGVDIAGAYAESLGTVGAAAKSMERYWENLQVLLGNTFQPAFKVVIEGMSQAMKEATEWATKNAGALTKLGEAIGSVMTAGVEFSKLLRDIGGGSEGASEGVGFLTDVFRGVAVIIAATTDVLRAFWGELSAFVGDLIQKIGRVVDLVTTLAGFEGKGGISRAGASLTAYGEGITAKLNNSTATGRTLDTMMPSHATEKNPTAEVDRIAAALKRQQEAAKAAAAAATDYKVAAKTAYAGEDSGFMYFSMQESNRQDLPTVATFDQAAYDYSVSIKRLEKDLARFRAENVSTWDIIATTVADSSRMASDELVIWMDNLDGVGRSWTTLGDTVKNVLRDIIIQMQRAIIQQQLMDPLIKWGIAALGGAFGGYSGTTATTGGTAGGGLNWGEVVGSAGPAPQASIVVNVSTEGKADTSAAGAGGVDLARMIEPVIDAWALKNSRQGGLLARA